MAMPYESDKVYSDKIFCATGDHIDNQSISLLAYNEDKADYFIVVVEGVTSTLLQPNEYGWALTKLDKKTYKLEKGKEYTCYTISYKDGVKSYSEKNSFVF